MPPILDVQHLRVIDDPDDAPATTLEADLLIAGGGLGGVAAALAACRRGRRVILAEETDWVGGQLTLAGLVPALRKLGPEATRAVARQFDRIAWPAFAVVVATGIWNVLEVDLGTATTSYQVSLGLKLVLVTVTGLGAAAHRATSSKVVLAVGGAAAAIGALGALFVGVQLHG